jgi:gliding motility-associated-like protein
MKSLILLVVILFFSMKLNASHIIGGDIYYDYLGNNQYKFYITLYRDCNSTGAQFDDPMKLTIYKADGSLFANLDVPFPGSTYVPIPFNNPCATPPNNLCVEKAVYTIVVNLPPISGGYNVSYQRCCRGPNITNLISPDDTGLTLTTHVPGQETGFTNNSSPRFTYYPPMLLCNNEQKTIDHSATDPDGDELVYSLVTPNSGANSSNPMPAQAPAPPYFPVQWASGFGAVNPLGPGSTVTINPTTGIINVDPNMIGLFVVGVRVQEFRNGSLVGETVRDFLFRVFDCNITMQAILPLQEDLSTFVSYCQGLTVQFENQSYGGTSYAWDFGVAGSTSDVSSSFAPSFTFPTPGSYLTRLIVNPGMPCTDTAYMNIVVNNPFSLSWTSQDSICILGNTFNFTGISSNTTATFSWDFDSDASIQSSSSLNVPNVSYTQPGFHVVTLNGDDGDCATSYTDSVYIFDLPVSSIEIPPEIQCFGLTIPFGNNSLNASNYQWDFGISGINTDVSTLIEPTFTFPASGNYTIQLIAGSSGNCKDTSSIQVTLNEPLIMSFTHNDSLCITDGLYNFDGSASGQPSATFQWLFGPNAFPNSATSLDVSGVEYLNPGNHEVLLVGSYDICKDTISSNVFVYGEPSINFQYLNALQCAPSNAQFINLSESDAPTIYSWDFGDGGSSNLFSPGHMYINPGSYSVGLTMITLKGCVDTLYMMQQDIVQVFPGPKAGFMVNPNKVDICDSEVQFIDQSIDATEYFYFFDNRQFTTTEANFTHQYTQSGGDYPIQIVTNQYGCSDTAVREVFVEPFSIYVPNTFIPDGNLLNDLFIPMTAYDVNGWEFQIFNKWGELIFETEQCDQGWDGTFEGKPCQDGTYIYVLKYKPCDNPYATQQITGFVNLLR